MQSHTHTLEIRDLVESPSGEALYGRLFFGRSLFSPFGYDLKFGAGARWWLGFFTLEFAVLERTCCCGVLAPRGLRMYVRTRVETSNGYLATNKSTSYKTSILVCFFPSAWKVEQKDFYC